MNQKNTLKKTILLAGVFLLIVALGVFAFYKYSNSVNDVRRNQSETSVERSENELKETKDIQDKPEYAKQQTKSDIVSVPAVDSETGLRNVNVVLTSTGSEKGEVDASGFVSNIVEEGGICTFTFSQNQKSIKKTTATAVNPTSTTCLTIRFNESELGPGDWKVNVQYNSSNASGMSNESLLVIK